MLNETKTTVSVRSYGNYSSDNYGAHALRVSVGSLNLYFSYKTCIAFENGRGLKVSENVWGPTTGKHLNWLDSGNKKKRLPRAQFEQELAELLQRHQLEVA